MDSTFLRAFIRWKEAQAWLRLQRKLKKRMRELRGLREAQEKKAESQAKARRRIQRSVKRIVNGHSDAERKRVKEKYLMRHHAEANEATSGCKQCDPAAWKRCAFANWDFGLPGPGGEREINTLDLLD
ncbi:uncharacterized protein Z520_04825 [Fonsecaea multimorphosa CBS 102226]|uniref:Uncharacterized protein n=1 Tax=Fonsecaea multimorphosa CBS 102226 TaxID=1442371 RepID=A0A0D2K7V4_9EURO|nr:uncharacterized protein Z520_04825 [Fonsecaea multimorphosa CBS 102226]KIX99249.1 hypothetical protein Z520_04825 [Fonsecaea multimorphosa CBS 102226]OAL25941.1 hypothetical protein AYO22_04568 [Fonsecaea multimorphosa]